MYEWTHRLADLGSKLVDRQHTDDVARYQIVRGLTNPSPRGRRKKTEKGGVGRCPTNKVMVTEKRKVKVAMDNLSWSMTEMADFNRGHNAPFGEDYAAGDENLIVSKHIFLSQDDKKVCGSPHILAIGNTGSGKTRNVILPNLMRAYGSYIVVDPDGSMLAESDRELSKNGYSVKVIDFGNPEASDHYNPLRYVRTDEDVRILVDCILDNFGGNSPQYQDPFWNKTEAAVLSSIILYLLHFLPKKEQTMRQVLSLAILAKDNPKRYDDLFENARRINDRDSAVAAYDNANLASQKTSLSARTAVVLCLMAFNGQPEEDLSIDDTVELDKLCDRKTAVFLTGFHIARKQAILVPMLFTQIFKVTAYHVAYECETRHAEYPLTLLMDELANLGYIPELDHDLATMKGVGLTAIMAIQSYSQLMNAYPKTASAILSVCGAVVYTSATFGGDLERGMYATEPLGSTSIHHGGEDWERPTDHMDREPVFTSSVRRIPQDKCLIYIPGMPVCMDEKYTIASQDPD